MKRLLLALVVFAELSTIAMLSIAIRYGRFDQGAVFFVYVFGAIAALSVAIGAALPVKALSHTGTHGLLLLGCIVFSLPFVWLVSTSFKYDEEIFVYPPKWVPSTPPAVLRSPYLTDEELRPVERPLGVEADRWESLWPKLEAALWQRGAGHLGEDRAGDFASPRLRDLLVQGLWNRVSAGVSPEVWSGDDAAVLAAVPARVDAESVEAVWEQIYRAVMLRGLSVIDDDLVEFPVGGASLGLWRPAPGSQDSVRLTPSTVARVQGLTLAYDLSESERAGVVADLPLPVPAEQLFSLTVPLRQDRSWHRLDLRLEFGGTRYVLEDAVYLGQRRWQEFTFKLKHKDERDERDMSIWPLVPAEDQSGAFDEPGKMRLALAIDRAAQPQAVWRKFTSSYKSAYVASQHRWNYVFNSGYLVVLTVLGQILSCSMVAYAFARLKFPGREPLFLLLLATMMLPGAVTMVPVFVVFKYLGWYNTLKALWAPAFFGSAFYIFMLRQFMKSIPVELEEAARIDGCGFFGIYWRIILPLVRPALAAVAIFTFMGTWNDFMGPLIYINDQRLYPLSLGLFDFRTQHGAEYGMLMAASTLMTLPVILIFFVAQRYFIEGVTLTGMKA